ncbi:MAG: hypothetical protein WD991_00865 [Candidatus Paceibacterota bacterium]
MKKFLQCLAVFLFVFSASQAAAQTTQPTTGLGYVDYRACDVVAGWGLDLTATGALVTVRVYKGPGKSQLVYDRSTLGLRPDVNAHFGLTPTEAVPHTHGFHFRTPVALKTGGPVPVMVVGVTAMGEEYPLVGGEFVLTCAAPPAIEGTVRNERNMPVSTEGLGAYLTLYRINDEGIAEWLVSTDCARNIGCANAQGNFRFAPSDLGFELEEGREYQVRAEAGWHHYSTQSVWYYAQYGGGYVFHSLRLHEVLVGVSSPSYKFLSGSSPSAMITVCNVGLGGDYSFVGFDIIIRGAGRNSAYVERIDEYGFILPRVGDPCYEFSWAVHVPADLPNGHWYNFAARFKNRSRKDEVYGENSWSAAKVAFTKAVPLGDAMVAERKMSTGPIPFALLGIKK